jgi:hypothetical protein
MAAGAFSWAMMFIVAAICWRLARDFSSQLAIVGAVPVASAGLLLSLRYRIRQQQAEQKIRRRKAGLCPSCGYDLCATKNRCPECGTVTL